MTTDKGMSEDELYRRLCQCREDWAKQCANVANFAFRLAELRSTGSYRMPKHLQSALDGIGTALPFNPREWTAEHKARILATKLVPEQHPPLVALDGLAELYAETKQALREARRKKREECEQ